MNQQDFYNQQNGYDGQYDDQYNVPPSQLMQMTPGYDPASFDGSAYRVEDVNFPLDQPVVLAPSHGNVNFGSEAVPEPSQHGPGPGVDGNGYHAYNQATTRRNAEGNNDHPNPLARNQPPNNNVRHHNRGRAAGTTGVSTGPESARASRLQDGRLGGVLKAGNGLSRSDPTPARAHQVSTSQLANSQKPPQTDQPYVAAARATSGALQAQIHALSQDFRAQKERGHNLEKQLVDCHAELARMQSAFEEEQASREIVLQAVAALGYRIWHLKKDTVHFEPDELERLGVLGNAAKGFWPNEDREQDRRAKID